MGGPNLLDVVFRNGYIKIGLWQRFFGRCILGLWVWVNAGVCLSVILILQGGKTGIALGGSFGKERWETGIRTTLCGFRTPCVCVCVV